MLERFGIDRNDLRNLGIFIVIMTVVMAYQFDGESLVLELIAGLIAALMAGVVFLVVTVIIYALRPEYR